jgi:hypothetical protein
MEFDSSDLEIIDDIKSYIDKEIVITLPWLCDKHKIGTNRARRIISSLMKSGILYIQYSDITDEMSLWVNDKKESLRNVKVIDIDTQHQKQKEQNNKLLEHKNKNSKGLTFCQFCGYDIQSQKIVNECKGRKHGHNFVFAKDQNSNWVLICNRCGTNEHNSEFPCV